MAKIFPMDDAKNSAAGRIPQLDSLRGLAALAVFFHHFYMTFTPAPDLNSIWFHMGRAAVILFFVLSGYALTCSLRTPQTYPRYLARRFIRLYLPFLAAIALSAGLVFFLHPRPVAGLSPWFNQSMWALPLSFHAIAQHLLLLGSPAGIDLDNVVWSLVYEMRISLFFPLLLWITGRWPGKTGIVVVVILFLTLNFLNYCPFIDDRYAINLLYTAYFALFATLGILLADHAAFVTRAYRKCRPAYRYIFLLIGLAALASPKDMGVGAGAAMITIGAINEPALANLLGRRQPLAWGRRSYSFYLVHLPVLQAVFHLLYGRLAVALLCTMTVALSLILAETFYRLVELPATRLSRTWTPRAAL